MCGFHRRDLLTLPAQRCTRAKTDHLPFADKKRTQYIITANRYELKGRDILKATLFNAISRAPKYLIFCDSGNNEFWTYDVASRKWREIMIHNIPDDSDMPMLAIANDGDTVAAEYFGQPNRLTSYCILDFELDVRDMQGRTIPSGVKKRYYESKAYLNTVMQQAGSLPMDIGRFIDKHVLLHSRYLYYKRYGKTLNGFCSHCRTAVVLPVPRNAKKGKSLNEIVTSCPYCHSKVKLKMAGRACEMRDCGRMEYIQRVADGFLVRSMVVHRQHDANYRKYRPVEWIEEDFRTYFPFSGCPQSFEYYHHHVTGKDEWIFQQYREPFNGVVYSKNLRWIFRKTKFQHSGLYEFIQQDGGSLRSDRYLEKYLSAPVLELFSKMGMTRLVRSAIGDSWSSFYFKNPHATNPADALGVTKKELREMRALNISGDGCKLWLDLKNAGHAVNTDMMKRLWSYGITQFWSIERIAKYGDILKTVQYMQSQGEQVRNLGDWADYMMNCKKLGYDIADKRVKYPRAFRKIHDRVADEVASRENKFQCKAFAALYQKYSKIYEYEDEKFIVILPKSPNDLIREGREMHHCVGTYINRYTEEESIILLIRRRQAPDVPFITAEISPDNRPVQIQDKYDRRPPEEVLRFWEKYQDVVLTAAVNKTVKNRKAG
jgi:hypothetical protein